MARRVFSVTDATGVAAAALVLAMCLGTLAAVAMRADGVSALTRYDWRAIQFTLVQAALSGLLSVLFAIPVARALARRRFFGRSVLVTLLGAPFILPVIVAILGLTAVFGRNGWVSGMLIWAGFEPFSIYGFHGVILAHVFFNLPLATRLLVQGWATVPAENFRLATSLRFRSRDVFRHIEWPMLRAAVPGAFAVIFLICTTSFAVALTFGGGPNATTVELAIYEAFRYDFDLGRAALLSVVQFLICTTAVVISLRMTLPPVGQDRQDRIVRRFDAAGAGARAFDGVWIVLAALFLIAPLTALFAKGMGAVPSLPASVWLAAGRSVLTALGSATIAIVLAVTLALAAQRHRAFEAIGTLSIAASPLVIGTGLFLILFPVVTISDVALPVTALVNAIMALPFCLRALVPAVRTAEADFGRLADGLNMQGWARLRLFVLPRIRGPLGFSAGLSAALSMGDLGVITLFAPPDGATLPLQIYRLMGSYRMEQASGAALLLLALALVIFYIFDRWGRSNA